MNILLDKEIDSIWEKNKTDFNLRLNNWVKALSRGQEVSTLAKTKFHQWQPLKTYISVGKASSASRAIYSMRFYGQEVANLIVKNEEVILCLNGHARKNEHWFGVRTKDDSYPWHSAEAKNFRLKFKNIAARENGFPKVKTPEHRIESKFIAEMCKGAGKFQVAGLQIQPITIAEKFPLQVPVPISANTGKPKAGTGYIDILARRKAEDHKVRLSVWELKKPQAYKHAAFQAYIYSYTLLKILRQSESRTEWYKLFGFQSAIPPRLTVEAVVAITEDQQKKFLTEKKYLMDHVSFNVKNDYIKLYVVYYKENQNSITIIGDSFSREL